MLAPHGTSIKIGTMRAFTIRSDFGAANRTCLAMGLLSPGAERSGHVPAFQYEIQPGEGT